MKSPLIRTALAAWASLLLMPPALALHRLDFFPAWRGAAFRNFVMLPLLLAATTVVSSAPGWACDG